VTENKNEQMKTRVCRNNLTHKQPEKSGQLSRCKRMQNTL